MTRRSVADARTANAGEALRPALSTGAALALAETPEIGDGMLASLMSQAAAIRDRAWGRTLTFSPKVFLPLTNVCRNRCDYCSFRRSPGDAGAWTMSGQEVETWLARAHAQGCIEALLCIGDKPERAFSAYRSTLRELGHADTVAMLEGASERALRRGLLPHTNAGVLTRADMVRLRPTNVSLGLMLENISPRLCERGMPHHRAPDKRPELRMAMLREAGRLRIPFTTGILTGIGETRRERVESLLAIRDVHAEYGHIQEVIVQNFTPRPDVVMSGHSEPADREMAHAIALARLILPAEISLQAPPNLNSARTRLLLDAGINDFGGISPVSPDYINPRHPWPALTALAEACRGAGFGLRPRLPIYPRYADDPVFVDAVLRPALSQARARLAAFDVLAESSLGGSESNPLPMRAVTGRL